MLQISTTPRDPVWVDLGDGARIQFKPLTTQGLAAGRGMVRVVAEAGESVDVASVAFTLACARWGAIAWEGVGDEDGQPIEISADLVEALLEQNEAAYRAVDVGWVHPALLKASEKNASAPSQPGASPGSAPKTGRARAQRSADATTARPASKPAPSARLNSTVRKPKPAKRPGA